MNSAITCCFALLPFLVLWIPALLDGFFNPSRETLVMTRKLLTPAQASSQVRRFREEPIPFVPDTHVRIRSLMESEQSRFESVNISKAGKLNKEQIESSRRRYIALCVVDDNGNPYLKPEDLDGDTRLTNWLYNLCCEHNGVREDDREALVGNC